MIPLVTNVEVAKRLRVAKRTVTVLHKAGAFPCIRLSPRTLRYDPADVARYMERNKVGGSQKWPSTLRGRIAEALGDRIPPSTQLVTPREVQQWLGISETTLYRWAKEGQLKPIYLRPLKLTRFDAADVQAMLESRRPDHVGPEPDVLAP